MHYSWQQLNELLHTSDWSLKQLKPLKIMRAKHSVCYHRYPYLQNDNSRLLFKIYWLWNREMAQWLRWLSCSVKAPSLDSQQPHDSSQLSVTLVTGDLMSSSGHGRHFRHMVCSQYRQNSNIHNIKQTNKKTIKDINCECLVFMKYIFQVLKLLLKNGRICLHFKLREKHIIVISEEIKQESHTGDRLQNYIWVGHQPPESVTPGSIFGSLHLKIRRCGRLWSSFINWSCFYLEKVS